MRMRFTVASHRRLAAVLAALALAASQALVASAHVAETAGPYSLEIGWHVEPAYVAQPNAVEVTISEAAHQPVTDLGADDLHVVVATAGQSSQSLPFEPAFDLAEGDGTPGQYIAKIDPTAPGDYSFHVTGTIHGQAVDITVASGDATFDPVAGTSEVEFPVKLPTVAEISTHLDRIDGRINQLGGGSPTDPTVAIADAKAAADRALLVGAGMGSLGVVVGLAALLRRRPGRAVG